MGCGGSTNDVDERPVELKSTQYGDERNTEKF